MTGVTWLPGPGWAVATSGFIVWVPGALDAALANELFDLSGPEAFTGAGDLLATKASAYALLQTEGPLVLQNRGGVGVRAWDATGAALSSDLATATGVVLGGTGLGEGGLPISTGVVTCGSIRWGATVASPTSSPATIPAKGAVQVPAPPEVPVVAVGGFIAEVPEWVARPQPNPFAELWGHTMRRPVEAAAVRVVRDSDAEPDAPAAAPVDEPPAGPVPPDPTPAAPEPPRSHHAPAMTATLIGDLLDPDRLDAEPDHGEVVASDGRRLSIVSTVVLGRAPQAVPELDCQLLRLASPQRSISRNHALISLIDGVVRAKDLGSNNGTVLVRRDVRIPVGTDSWTALRSGDVLDFGEDVTVHLVGLP